jgi:hypothetical protein
MQKTTALFLVLGFTVLLKAQHQEVPEKPQMWKGKSKSFYDTGAISKAFQYGVMQGHFRYFYMNTQNSGELSDYYANSGGGGIRYETAPYRGLQFAVSGFYIFNLQSSNLGEVDTWALSGNRYELGLIDIEDPENKKDLDLAKKHQTHIDYRIGGFMDIKFPEEHFDLLVYNYVHMPKPMKAAVFRRHMPWMKPNSTVIFEAFSVNNLPYREANPGVGGPDQLDMLYSIEEVKELLDGFSNLKVWEEEVNLSEGKYHIGKAKVIRAINK